MKSILSNLSYLAYFSLISNLNNTKLVERSDWSTYFTKLTSDFSVVGSKYLGSTEQNTIRTNIGTILRFNHIILIAFCDWTLTLAKLWKRRLYWDHLKMNQFSYALHCKKPSFPVHNFRVDPCHYNFHFNKYLLPTFCSNYLYDYNMYVHFFLHSLSIGILPSQVFDMQGSKATLPLIKSLSLNINPLSQW